MRGMRPCDRQLVIDTGFHAFYPVNIPSLPHPGSRIFIAPSIAKNILL